MNNISPGLQIGRNSLPGSWSEYANACKRIILLFFPFIVKTIDVRKLVNLIKL